jgi:peptidoglycan L-alanyl-D-glutamate endopeptidase CwlK
MSNVARPSRICSDLEKLLPSFRLRVGRVCELLREEGFQPRVFETYRTPERAALLLSLGKTRNGKLSLHCLGAAADLIDAQKKWDNPKFFIALGAVAKTCGLAWGGDWKSLFDGPHIQAVPVELQNELRALPSAEARDRYIAEHLAKTPLP